MPNTLKTLIEMIEQELEQQDLLQSIENIVSSAGGGIVKTSKGNIYKIVSDDRMALEKVLTPQFAELGMVWEPNAPGAGFGRYKLPRTRREGGSVYFLKKPRSGGAARAGAQYEERLVEIMKQLLPSYNVDSAGSGPGSDLVIADDNSSLQIELKTSSGADFGQFKMAYQIGKRQWTPVETKGYLKNEQLYSGIFQSAIKPAMANKHIDIKRYPKSNLNIKDNIVYGLRRASHTGAVKIDLQQRWFGDRTDMNLPVDGALIQNYYALKGDELIQIQGKGVYALTPRAASYFEIPELKDNVKKSQVRIRIKPHSSTDGVHSFTCALKLGLSKSGVDLTDEQFLVKIKAYLEET
jgi:hypothetical protein